MGTDNLLRPRETDSPVLVYFAAVLEYLAAENLELGGNVVITRNNVLCQRIYNSLFVMMKSKFFFLHYSAGAYSVNLCVD